jgi:hypothetical protein
MSKGTPVRSVRLSEALWQKIDLYVEFRNRHSQDEAWTMSDFMAIAVIEKMEKMDRSRGRILTVMDEMVDLTTVAQVAGEPDLFFHMLEKKEANS